MHTNESIAELLERNDKAVVKGLQSVAKTAGFMDCDHAFASSLLTQVGKWENADPAKRYAAPLSSRQFYAARQLLGRYTAVLARLANEREAYKREAEETVYDDSLPKQRPEEALCEREYHAHYLIDW